MVVLSSCHSSHKASKSGSNLSEEHKELINKAKKGSKARSVVEEALSWVGTPYRYGGNSRKGVDCSGLTTHVFDKAADIKLPRNSSEQAKFCKEIKKKNLRSGDLVFFTSKSRGNKINHVAIYIGDNKIVHATTSRGVIISNLDEKYWKSHYRRSGRVKQLDD